MLSREFKPGFRCSAFDMVVLAGGAAMSAFAWDWTSRLGFVIAFVIGHFFLFCNVFRISRALELIWAGVFLTLTLCTLSWKWPGWGWTVAVSLVVTVVAIAIEMRKLSYHGIGWRWINPRLRDWWRQR